MSPAQSVSLPPKSDGRWAGLVKNGTSAPLKLLALKMVLSRMNRDVKSDPSAATLARNVDELHAFFIKNARMVEPDLAALFG